jgi:hypothetical protein
MPKKCIKSYFLVVSDYFSYNNGPIDLIRGLFSSLDIGTYIPSTCRPCVPFLGPIRGAQMPQNSINTHFLDVLDHFSYKNGPIDLVRGPFSDLDTGTYIRPTCRPVCTFLGPFGGAQMPQNKIEKYFLVVPDHFPYKNGPIDSVRSLFSSLDIGTYISPTCGPLSTFLVHLGVPKSPKTAQKNYFLVAPDHFFLKNELIHMVRGLFSSLNIGTYILPTCGPLCTFFGSIWGYPNAPKQH